MMNTHDPSVSLDSAEPLNRARLDGCMEIMKQLGKTNNNHKADLE